jgi:hypothetical protein
MDHAERIARARQRVAEHRAERDRHAATLRRLACDRECAAAAFDRASYALAAANIELDRAINMLSTATLDRQWDTPAPATGDRPRE